MDMRRVYIFVVTGRSISEHRESLHHQVLLRAVHAAAWHIIVQSAVHLTGLPLISHRFKLCASR